MVGDRPSGTVLVVHGTGDDNVHPHNSVRLAAELIAARLQFEQVFLPGEMHALKPPGMRHYLARMTEFFDRHLERGRR